MMQTSSTGQSISNRAAQLCAAKPSEFDPLEIADKYHLINENTTIRSEALAARLNEKWEAATQNHHWNEKERAFADALFDAYSESFHFVEEVKKSAVEEVKKSARALLEGDAPKEMRIKLPPIVSLIERLSSSIITRNAAELLANGEAGQRLQSSNELKGFLGNVIRQAIDVNAAFLGEKPKVFPRSESLYDPETLVNDIQLYPREASREVISLGIM